MPSSPEHRAKYEANRAFLDSGCGGMPLAQVNACWASIVTFYTALQLVDRLAARINAHPQTHADRLRFLTRTHPSIFQAYAQLKIASELSRYGTLNQFLRAYPDPMVQTILIDQHLVALETYFLAIFQPPPAPPPVSP